MQASPIRLWYQSMTQPDAWPAYNETLRRVLAAIADPGTDIEVHGISRRGGVGDQYRYLAFIETIEVLDNVDRAAREGFDAFLIGNIADPGLDEARELAPMPVLALCESSVHLASTMGASFALVTGNQKHAPRIVDNVTRYGLRQRLHSVRAMTVERLVDLDAAFSDPGVRSRLVAEFVAAARAAADEGAEVVIPAIGVLMTLLADEGVWSIDARVPVMNGVVALVKQAEATVRMRRLMGGTWTSRRSAYAPPPPSQIDEMRRYYGDVYPGSA